MTGNSAEKDPLKVGIVIVALLAVAIFALLLIKNLLLPLLTSNPNPSDTPKVTSPASAEEVTSTVTPTDTVTPTGTVTFAPIEVTSTYTSLPIPDISPTIINGPELFRVESWNSNDELCRPEVIIYGVTISHGNAPYIFTFWSQNEPYTSYNPVINQIISLPNQREYVEFTPPIVIVRDKYKLVQFTFKRTDGETVTWIDHLLYLTCT